MARGNVGGGGRGVEDVFAGAEPGAPFSAAEVADAIGVDERRARALLRASVDAGRLRSKALPDGGRVWWRPLGGSASPADDALVEVEYRSASLAAPFLAAFEAIEPTGETVPTDAEIVATVDSVVPLRDGALQYYTVRGVSPGRYLAALRRIPGLSTVRLLSTDGDEVRVEVRLEADGLADLFRAFGGWVTGGTLLDSEIRIRGTVRGETDVADVTAAVREWVPDAELVRRRTVHTPRIARTILTDRLSTQQSAALEAAYYGGYFAVPRRSTGEDIATSLGVTRQTFNHHLRLAELAVVRELFGVTDDDAL
ncbi:bacterio-opsin activator domain-containing protein [Halobaculum lipolyticum]|uniref:Bacterio-opsin activator domain-containing protein n=1 Tax=Halobaculum lipolyticum TaxID=3032001 RepID=A0ABD5WHM1_9EURY|nr:bacterio-opsin activator domain-containing protein [Halobaculum sp. DT31]